MTQTTKTQLQTDITDDITTNATGAISGLKLRTILANIVDSFIHNEQQSQILGINSQTGTSYTLVLGDAGKLVEMSNAAANTLTVPPNSSVAFPVNTKIDVSQMGAGATTIAQGSGVTIRSKDTKLALNGRYVVTTLIKRATDEWVLVGDLA